MNVYLCEKMKLIKSFFNKYVEMIFILFITIGCSIIYFNIPSEKKTIDLAGLSTIIYTFLTLVSLVITLFTLKYLREQSQVLKKQIEISEKQFNESVKQNEAQTLSKNIDDIKKLKYLIREKFEKVREKIINNVNLRDNSNSKYITDQLSFSIDELIYYRNAVRNILKIKGTQNSLSNDTIVRDLEEFNWYYELFNKFANDQLTKNNLKKEDLTKAYSIIDGKNNNLSNEDDKEKVHKDEHKFRQMLDAMFNYLDQFCNEINTTEKVVNNFKEENK